MSLPDFFAKKAREQNNSNLPEVKVWATFVRDARLNLKCNRWLWNKSRFIPEDKPKDWTKWKLEHESRLNEILSDLPKYLPPKIWDLIKNKDYTIDKNFPIKANIQENLVITGRLDIRINIPGSTIAVIEVKSYEKITEKHVVQTMVYVIVLHLMFKDRDIVGVICNGVSFYVIRLSDLDVSHEISEIAKSTAFLLEPQAPVPIYFFDNYGRLCCDSCGYNSHTCEYRTSTREYFNRL